MSKVRWLAMNHRRTGGTSETLHAVPVDSAESFCGAKATEANGRFWIAPVAGMHRHRVCERKIQDLHKKAWCPDEGKVRFAVKEKVLEALTNARISHDLHGRARRKEQGYYPCRYCQGWHLTSQSKE